MFGEVIDGSDADVRFKAPQPSMCRRRKKTPPPVEGSGARKKKMRNSVGAGSRVHIDAAAFAVEGDTAVDQRKKGVVAANADAEARMYLGPALADQDVSCDDRLATEFLNAEALAA
jgi:hypothetical protein